MVKIYPHVHKCSLSRQLASSKDHVPGEFLEASVVVLVSPNVGPRTKSRSNVPLSALAHLFGSTEISRDSAHPVLSDIPRMQSTLGPRSSDYLPFALGKLCSSGLELPVSFHPRGELATRHNGCSKRLPQLASIDVLEILSHFAQSRPVGVVFSRTIGKEG